VTWLSIEKNLSLKNWYRNILEKILYSKNREKIIKVFRKTQILIIQMPRLWREVLFIIIKKM